MDMSEQNRIVAPQSAMRLSLWKGRGVCGQATVFVIWDMILLRRRAQGLWQVRASKQRPRADGGSLLIWARNLNRYRRGRSTVSQGLVFLSPFGQWRNGWMDGHRETGRREACPYLWNSLLLIDWKLHNHSSFVADDHLRQI